MRELIEKLRNTQTPSGDLAHEVRQALEQLESVEGRITWQYLKALREIHRLRLWEGTAETFNDFMQDSLGRTENWAVRGISLLNMIEKHGKDPEEEGYELGKCIAGKKLIEASSDNLTKMKSVRNGGLTKSDIVKEVKWGDNPDEEHIHAFEIQKRCSCGVKVQV